MSDPNLPDTSGFTPFQPVYSNPRNGQLITLCQIVELLSNSGVVTTTTGSVGTSSAVLLSGGTASRYLLIQNTSNKTLYVSSVNPATSANSIAISAGTQYQFPFIPSNTLYCLGGGSSTTYSIIYA